MLRLKNISYHLAQRALLDRVNIQISPRQRVGLVGRNGSGKSTLFKIIQKELFPDQGDVDIPKYWKILAVRQEMPEGHLTPLEYVLMQDHERLSLMEELESCVDMERMGEIYERLIQIDAYTAESRAAVILKGLGFDDAGQQTPLKQFSGGFRMRVALAAVLFQSPDLLLLDEPTNHLDLETTQWLASFLKKYPKSFLLVSHERDFINETVQHILHLKHGRADSFSGNFDAFIRTYTMQQEMAVAYNTKLEQKRAHMMSFVNRFRYKASKSKQAQSRLKAVEKMQWLPVDSDDPSIAFNFPEPEYLVPPLLQFDKVTLGYADKDVLHRIRGSLTPDDRIALVGKNGQGKTTLARFLAGELPAKSGEYSAHSKLQIAFYRQDQLETLEEDNTPYVHVQKRFPDLNNTQIRTHLGRFGFPKEKAEQRVKDLSGGERARLLFACLTADRPNLLILDEPTNHLDMEMRESLIAALQAYQGAVVLITHDRYLLKHVADRLWIVKDGTLSQFDGDIETYEKSLLDTTTS